MPEACAWYPKHHNAERGYLCGRKMGACFILSLENMLADYQVLYVRAFRCWFHLPFLLDVCLKLVFQNSFQNSQDGRRRGVLTKLLAGSSLCKQHAGTACFCSITCHNICQTGFYVLDVSWNRVVLLVWFFLGGWGGVVWIFGGCGVLFCFVWVFFN